jgi:HD domain
VWRQACNQLLGLQGGIRDHGSAEAAVTRRGFLSAAAMTADGVLVGVGLAHGRATAATGGSLGAAVRPQAPRSRLARAVGQLLRSSSPTFLVQHCQRSFQLALLIAAARGLQVDIEVLFAGVMLHDLGLTPTYHAPQVRFEVVSANAARALAREHGMSRRRADNVWDVAALHGTGGISDFKSPETATGADGIGADVTGAGLEQFDQDQISQIMATRPGFARPFIDAIVADLRDKPQAASSTWMPTLAADHIPGFHQPSIEQLALNSPYEHPPNS